MQGNTNVWAYLSKGNAPHNRSFCRLCLDGLASHSCCNERYAVHPYGARLAREAP